MTACATCARSVQPAWKFCIYCGTQVAQPEVEAEPEVEAQPVVELVETTTATEPKMSFVLDAPILPPLALSPEPVVPAVQTPSPRFSPLARMIEITTTRSRRARAALSDDDDSAPTARRSRPLPTPVLIPDTTGPIVSVPSAPSAPSVSAPSVSAPVDDVSEVPAAEVDLDTRGIETFDTNDLGIHHLDLPELQFPEPSAPDSNAEAERARSGLTAPTSVLADPKPEVVPERHHDLDAWEDEDWDEDDRTGSVNTLAIIALAMGVLASPLAALFGHLALSQLKVSGERGVIPAWIALVLGYLWLGAWIVFGVSYLTTNG